MSSSVWLSSAPSTASATSKFPTAISPSNVGMVGGLEMEYEDGSALYPDSDAVGEGNVADAARPDSQKLGVERPLYSQRADVRRTCEGDEGDGIARFGDQD